ncbi:uncharacterized protein [Clytia hemisphaerica]|uniref:uncharacterized protein n=1 Tax=Clytia hemisphaerica TaxID=252671 RepID=UPI0034D5875F
MDSLIQEFNKTRRGSQKPALDVNETQTLNKSIASVANLTSAVNARILNFNVEQSSSHSFDNTQNASNVEGINPVNLESEPISVSLAQPNFKPFIKRILLAMLVLFVSCLVIYLMKYDCINRMIGFYRSIDSDTRPAHTVSPQTQCPPRVLISIIAVKSQELGKRI